MNQKQLIKYDLIKNSLMAISFDWIGSPSYTRNGETIFKSTDVCYAPNANEIWTLACHSTGLLYLSHVDRKVSIGFINEYNTDEKSVMELAEKIHKIAKERV